MLRVIRWLKTGGMGRKLVTLYWVLLLLSQGLRLADPYVEPPTVQQKVVEVAMVEREATKIRIAYHELGSPAKGSPTVLLLHGSPVGVPAMQNLMRELKGKAHVIAPDLPGFDASSRNLPDYSFRAHAIYMRRFLRQLKLEQVHVVAYSMGGGVGLHLYDDHPDSVKSLTMLSAIGLQEMELLGDYHLNRAVHGLQLGVIWSVHNLIPHFGYLDQFALNTNYARNFYDSDQRPLRGILERFEGPMLIVHGQEDVLIPVELAREHHRIVPQSRLEILPGGHLILMEQPQKVAAAILKFIKDVEAGQFLGRNSASEERMLAGMQSGDHTLLPPAQGMAFVFLLGLIVAATFLSEDLAAIGAGLLVAKGTLAFLPATLAAAAGIYLGDMLIYLLGRWFGSKIIQQIPFRWFWDEDTIVQAQGWFQRRGMRLLIMSRFFPGTRVATFFVAGTLKAPFYKTALFFLIAVALWTPLLVGLAVLLGGSLLLMFQAYTNWLLLGAPAVLLAFYLVLKVLLPLFSYRGRRLLYGAWKRKTHWEFWPYWLFHTPTFYYLFGRALSYGRLFIFTHCNPAIPGGGVMGESKLAILQGILDQTHVARFAPLSGDGSPEEKLQAAERFIQDTGTDFPLVVKPDQGQRGQGVHIVKSRNQLQALVAEIQGEHIMQEFAPGQEYGVFYYRMPDEEQGQIFSITKKQLLTVRGDGQQTLEELILSDDRAVCLAKVHFKQHLDRLNEVIPKGEQVFLVELGTHCRGAIFLDGMEIYTEALRQAIDRVSQSYAGFYFGRYDIRTPDTEAFKRGENFKIVELNGFTSEPTHIYDPALSLWNAWKVMFQHANLACEIGYRALKLAQGSPSTESQRDESKQKTVLS